MRQQIVFRQYNPSKPHRYSLLLKSFNDTKFPYTCKAVPYVEKPKAVCGPYYSKSTIDYIKYLLTKMGTGQPITGRTISNDRFYTRINSRNWLLDYGVTTVGTLQKGRSEIPSELFNTHNREIFSAICHFEKKKKNISLTS